MRVRSRQRTNDDRNLRLCISTDILYTHYTLTHRGLRARTMLLYICIIWWYIGVHVR